MLMKRLLMAWIIFLCLLSYGNVWVCFRPSELVKWHAIIISQFIHALTHQLTENLFKTKHTEEIKGIISEKSKIQMWLNTSQMKKYGVKPIWALFKFLFITRVINSCLLYVLFCIVVMFDFIFFSVSLYFLGVYCFNTVSVLLCCVFFHSCFFRWKFIYLCSAPKFTSALQLIDKNTDEKHRQNTHSIR